MFAVESYTKMFICTWRERESDTCQIRGLAATSSSGLGIVFILFITLSRYCFLNQKNSQNFKEDEFLHHPHRLPSTITSPACLPGQRAPAHPLKSNQRLPGRSSQQGKAPPAIAPRASMETPKGTCSAPGGGYSSGL